MNKFITSVALICFGLLSIGCNQLNQPSQPTASEKPTAGVAIIDLDEVARQLGSDKQIVNSLKQRQELLKNQLTELAKNYEAQFLKQKDAVEAQAEDAGGTVQLASYEQQVKQKFNSAKVQADQNLTQHKLNLVNKFRDAVRPAARKVAHERGYTVIVTKQDSLYDYDPECDITNEVVQVLRASAAAKKTAAKPANPQG